MGAFLSVGTRVRRSRLLAMAGCFALLNATGVMAAPNYIQGRISNVTFAHDFVMVMVDSGLPENCVGTGWGWLKIPAENKPMIAFVTGLWLRGDSASTFVTVYTDGLVDGYCRITQIDPEA
jgi:hypothetical protein